ncbi:MAG TPA: 30S ribosomal protein S16 [Chloroflexi bacterium]|nr:30S ribosomal protein S16 [Chloroflexota bacterium]
MIKIRLRRVGAKKQPHYRVVVADARSPRDGRFIEIIGHYHPREDPPAFFVEEERALYWLQQGAQPTEAVARMLQSLGTFEKLERLKAGESLEEILAEVRAEAAERERVREEIAEPVAPTEVEEVAPPEEMAEPAAEMSIEDMGLSGRVVNALTAAGIGSAGELQDKLAEGKEAIVALPGLGEKSAEEIEEALRAHGLLK